MKSSLTSLNLQGHISVEIVTFPLQAKVTITWDNRTWQETVDTSPLRAHSYMKRIYYFY